MKVLTLIFIVIALSIHQKTLASSEEILLLEEQLINSTEQNTKVDIYNKISKELLPYFTDEAQKYAKKAQKQSLKLRYLKGQLNALSNLAKISISQNNDKQALVYFYKKISLLNSLDNNVAIANTFLSIAKMYLNSGNYDSSEIYLTKSNDLSEQYVLAENIIQNKRCLANLFSQRGYFINAENLYETALDMALNENKTLLVAQIHLDLAKHFYDNKNYIFALDNAEKAYSYGHKIHNLELNVMATKYLTMVYKQLNVVVSYEEYDKLYSFYNNKLTEREEINHHKLELFLKREKEKGKLESLNQEIIKLNANNSSNSKNIHLIIFLSTVLLISLLIIFGIYIYKKEKSLKKIQLRNKRIKKIYYQQDLNKTREKILKLIAHDIKNPLHSLLGFSDILYNDFDKYSEIEKKKFIHYIYASSKNINELFTNLSDWLESQGGSNENVNKEIKLNELINKFLPMVRTKADEKNIKIKTSIANDIIAMTNPEMLSSILWFLISDKINITHNNGIISIQSEVINNKIELFVKTNAVKNGETNYLTKSTNGKSGRYKVNNVSGFDLSQEYIGKNNSNVNLVANKKEKEYKLLIPLATFTKEKN